MLRPAFWDAPCIEKLASAESVWIGAPTLVECGIVLLIKHKLDARGMLTRLLEEADVTVAPFADIHYGTTVEAWRKQEKGRQSAALHFGDCMADVVANWRAYTSLYG